MILLICDSHKFAFIHIQRTGGTSIRELCHKLELKTYEKEFFHTHVNNLKNSSTIPDDYRSFAFVRNPWDRVLSWYKLLTKYEINNNLKKIDFEDYVLNFEEINYKKDKTLSMLFNQYDYIYKDDKRVVDFIGRFENYSEDVKTIFSNFHIDVDSIPKVNDTKHKSYREYYTQKSAAYLEKMCYKDIQTFGYNFE